jgi:pilus assembly protein Flp/PilA
MSLHKIRARNTLRNQRGQGLIEYLIIVALMGVATIAIMRVMGEAVTKRFANITHALQGEESHEKATIDKSDLKKHDLGDFMNGAAKGKKGSGGSEGDN